MACDTFGSDETNTILLRSSWDILQIFVISSLVEQP